MTDYKSKMNSVTAFLNVALIASVVIVLVGIVTLLFIFDAYGVYAASICSASALLNSVGLILIMRRHKNGVLFVVSASVLSAIALSITCAGWLSYSFGAVGIYIPYLIMLLYVGTLFALMFHKIDGKSAWQQMDNSLDYAHFRHIYQLSVCILFVIFGIAYYVMPQSTESEQEEYEDLGKLVSNVSESRLDSPDVTIEEVVSFEQKYNEEFPIEKRDTKIVSRIFALKHLLLSGLMPELHSRDNLVNICMIHAGSFSKQQQEIIDWYLSLDTRYQSEWNVCDKVNTLSEFKDAIQKKIH